MLEVFNTIVVAITIAALIVAVVLFTMMVLVEALKREEAERKAAMTMDEMIRHTTKGPEKLVRTRVSATREKYPTEKAAGEADQKE